MAPIILRKFNLALIFEHYFNGLPSQNVLILLMSSILLVQIILNPCIISTTKDSQTLSYSSVENINFRKGLLFVPSRKGGNKKFSGSWTDLGPNHFNSHRLYPKIHRIL